jgi:pectin methylesterase-like acyl-CoA thioesterase
MPAGLTCGSVLIVFLLASNLRAAGTSVAQFFPAQQSTNACLDSPLTLTFDQPVSLGHDGKIEVHRSRDNALVDSFDLSAARFTNNFGGKTLRYDPVLVSSNVVSIHPHSKSLGPGETYSVSIAPGTFEGISNELAWAFSTRAALPKGRTNIIVAADGTGDFCTPQGAIDYVTDDNQTPVEIFVRKGVYEGMVYLASEKTHIHIIGEDRRETIIAGRNNDRFNSGRIGRALVSVDGSDFTLENITLHNTTAYGGSQAESLSVKSDRCILRNCDFYSFQDTLLLSGRVYVTNCYIEGDVDFIWGLGTVFFDQCEIKAVHHGYYLQARNPKDRPGYVFYHCKLTSTPDVTKCLLARIDADRFPYSQALFIHCQMGPAIPPYGWEAKGTNISHLSFEEFQSVDAQGNPVDVSHRIPASRQMTEAEAVEWSDPAKIFSRSQPWDPRN